MPKISVILPCYNSEAFIGSSIQSILDQTYRDFELIIIDDGSTDGSTEIIKSFHDTRIRYIRNPENLGLIKTLNIGIGLSEGMYIARMDADDISYPNRFEEQARYLDERSDVSLVGTGYCTIPSGKTFVPHKTPKLWDMLIRNQFAHPTVMFRKNNFLDNGLVYDENYNSAEDYELWSRALIKGLQCHNIPAPLLRYRLHPDSITARKRNEMLQTCQKVRRNLLAEFTTDPSLQAFLLLVARASRNSIWIITSFLKLKRVFKSNK